MEGHPGEAGQASPCALWDMTWIDHLLERGRNAGRLD